MRRMIIGLVAALCLVSTVAAGALPTPVVGVKCATGDVTLDQRIFPEPRLTATFLRFDEFECAIALLERTFPDLVEITERGDSSSGYPVYDVILTDETIADTHKEHLLVMSSIHGNEMAGREGAARVMEDMVDPRFGPHAEFAPLLDQFVVHFLFPNPDGWVNGDIYGAPGAGVNYTRRNDGPPTRDLNRNFPVQGFLRTSNGTLDQPEGVGTNELLLDHAGDWYLGTDNHGQGVKPVAASGLQIVGQFSFTKSERLAAFADDINGAMAEYGVLDALEVLNGQTGGEVKPYEWGTLYDILGYSASGSGIDYYNTPGVVGGTGFATEMTAANNAFSNALTHPGPVNQVWVDSTRAINYTMFRHALDPQEYTFPVGGRAAYVVDPAVVRHDDANGYGPGNADNEGGFEYQPYSVSRMRFFEDLNDDASQPLDAVGVPDVVAGLVDLSDYDSLVIADDAQPEAADTATWIAKLDAFVRGGGNLILTDGAMTLLESLALVPSGSVEMHRSDVGFVDFGDRAHLLNADLRGVASQTYDVIPIGYPDNEGEAPNWTVPTSAVDGQGGSTAGTNGTDRTIYGEFDLGEGRVRFLGALLPQPTEDYYHPFGLQNYAVTYTGYTLLANMLAFSRG